MDKENILGFDVCNTNYDKITDDIINDFNNNVTNFIVNVNPEIIIKNYKNNELKEKFNSQKYQIADGIGIIYASKIQKGNIKQRITGIDLMQKICEKSVGKDIKIFLYGSNIGVADKAKEELEKKYNFIKIVGTCDGYVDKEVAINRIKMSNANVLFVGLGSPKQENFIIENMEKLENIKIFMPVRWKF